MVVVGVTRDTCDKWELSIEFWRTGIIYFIVPVAAVVLSSYDLDMAFAVIVDLVAQRKRP